MVERATNRICCFAHTLSDCQHEPISCATLQKMADGRISAKSRTGVRGHKARFIAQELGNVSGVSTANIQYPQRFLLILQQIAQDSEQKTMLQVIRPRDLQGISDKNLL